LVILLTFFTTEAKENSKPAPFLSDGKINGRFLYSNSRAVRMMDSFFATLEARDPSLGRMSSYHLKAGTDLFGTWLVDVVYGRIGARGRRIRHVAQNKDVARKLVRRRLRRRATARKRISVSYRFRELLDPND
jgi:hypothetical protein